MGRLEKSRMLCARPGVDLLLHASGEDEEEALDALEALIRANFNET